MKDINRDKIIYNLAYIEGAIAQLDEGGNDDIYQAIDFIKEELDINF